MTVGEKLSDGVVQIQEAWTSLADIWMTTAHDLLDSASADPFGLLHPDAVVDQIVDLTRRAVEINWEVFSSLTGVSVTAEVAVGTTAIDAPTPQIVTAIEVPARDVDKAGKVEPPKPESLPSVQKATSPVAAEKYSRVTKADLQKALEGRNLPNSGTVKELRERLIEADRRAAH